MDIRTTVKHVPRFGTESITLVPPERNPQRRASNDAARKANREFVWTYLSGHPCVDCGEADPVVLEFDHVVGEKSFNISSAITQGLSILTIVEEIKKCEVRCCNCHRRVTMSRAGWYRALKQ